MLALLGHRLNNFAGHQTLRLVVFSAYRGHDVLSCEEGSYRRPFLSMTLPLHQATWVKQRVLTGPVCIGYEAKCGYAYPESGLDGLWADLPGRVLTSIPGRVPARPPRPSSLHVANGPIFLSRLVLWTLVAGAGLNELLRGCVGKVACYPGCI